MPHRVCVVTNATFPLKRYDGLYFYWVSMDGTEKVHNTIRGEGSYAKTKKNILDYVAGPNRNGKPAWKDIWITMTINSLNYMTVEDLAEEWKGSRSKQDWFSVPHALCKERSSEAAHLGRYTIKSLIS